MRVIKLLVFFACSFPILAIAVGSSYQPAISFPVGVSPRGIAVGNLFGNGVQSLIVANFGSSTFIGQSTPATLLDALNSSLHVLSPSPNGLKLMHVIPTASSPRGIGLFDLMNDGSSDILVTAYDSNLLQVFSLKEGQFVKSDERPTAKMPVGVAAGSTKSDGTRFVVVTGYASRVISFFPIKDGKLGERTDVTVDEGPTQVAIGDLDGDGINEVAVVCLPANKINILSRGSAAAGEELPLFTVTRTIVLPDGSGPADLRLSDLNGDGRCDMTVANFTKSTLSIFMQQNDGSLLMQAPLSCGGNRPNGLTVGDLHGDKKLEIIVANRDSDILDIFQWVDGSYQLTQKLKVSDETNSSFGPVEVGAMDVQGDGKMDLVTSHMRSNTLKIITQISSSIPAPISASSVSGEQGEPFSEETTFCYPNPSYDGKLNISFTLDTPKQVGILIFNIGGEMVWSSILNASQTRKGKNIIPWDGSNQSGESLASGLYLYRITVGDRTVTKKIAIIR